MIICRQFLYWNGIHFIVNVQEGDITYILLILLHCGLAVAPASVSAKIILYFIWWAGSFLGCGTLETDGDYSPDVALLSWNKPMVTL